MADLLSTILVTYSLLTVIRWWIDWLDERWIVLALAGTVIPDLTRIDLLLDARTVEQAVGVPFTYAPLGSLGGVVLVSAIVTLAFARRHWRRVYPLVLTGGFVGLFVDGLRIFADGRAGFYLYPVWWRPPTPGLFVSADPRVLVVTAALAAGIFAVDRFVIEESPGSSSP
ncbi:hypothetical protein [Halapricum salinum]|uniref:Uncharacterized protein n=1 Tax=Halapricum salinum TaxID=1457250 RepID=A0A4D6H891_9EURY|nr:hypothetical protein [Halapricum salinum]QCC50039.1 hypothetical protein DV733_01850 [Halapricum salinum]